VTVIERIERFLAAILELLDEASSLALSGIGLERFSI
jgi:hypothetical protein